MNILLIFAVLLVGCGRLAQKTPVDPDPAPASPDLEAERSRRLSEFQDLTRAASGWPSKTDCDAAVFAGAACLGGAQVDIGLAEYPAGTLNRRPPPACWTPEDAGKTQPSASTASRDDVTLYAACAYQLGDRGALERLLAYAGDHDGYIGLPRDVGLTFLGPNLQGIIARAVVKLGGTAHPWTANAWEAPAAKDYQQHIEVEEILFSSAVVREATGWELGLLDELVADSPQDPLFQAARGVYTGDQAEATRLLLDPATPVPSYVRGDAQDLFAKAWWLRAAAVVLNKAR